MILGPENSRGGDIREGLIGPHWDNGPSRDANQTALALLPHPLYHHRVAVAEGVGLPGVLAGNDDFSLDVGVAVTLAGALILRPLPDADQALVADVGVGSIQVVYGRVMIA